MTKEQFTLEEIEMLQSGLSAWKSEFYMGGDDWSDVDALYEKLERMKKELMEMG